MGSPSALTLPRSPALPRADGVRSRPAPRRDGLTRAQGRLVVAAIVGLHIVGAWAMLQIREVREAVRDAAPMFVSLIAPDKAPEPVVPPPPREPTKVVRQPPPVIAAAPTPQPAPAPAFVVSAPAEPPPMVETAVAAVATPPAPPLMQMQPKTIPSSAVQYLEPISLEYPRLSRKLGEAGRVMLHVWIGEDGLPKQVEVAQSSRFGRLDDAALGAVRKARFRPPTVDGQRVEGWAHVPIDFELEK